MSNTMQTEIGTVVSLWRYPVKSMLGEELRVAQVRDHGLLGDRAYGLVDSTDGKVATAKNPRKWQNLFAFGATFLEQSANTAQVPPVPITMPDCGLITSDKSDYNQTLTK